MGETYSCCPKSSVVLEEEKIGAGHDDLVERFGEAGSNARISQVVADLTKLGSEHPYLKPVGDENAPHHLLYWVRRCREAVIANKADEAEEYLRRVTSTLDYEQAQVADAFRRFDVDNSEQLDAQEFHYMCAYIGWGEEEAAMMDIDDNGFVTLKEFQLFVGKMGGLQRLFEHRRQRVARKQWGIEAAEVLMTGSRVRAYYHMQDGKKSSSCKEGQILELHVKPSGGVLVDFGVAMAEGEKASQDRQVVPQSWIFSDTRDNDVVTALREVGILQEQQAFWASIFPQSELRAVEKLVACQRQALATVRANAAMSHDEALPKVRERFTKLGFGEKELQAVFGWVQDLAPMVVQIHIDQVGRFMETDEYYRTQFETGTSRGALDSANNTRKRWEKELFGGAYEEAKPFERCKYGALGVMNDYRGVLSAYQYGDSYLVLKDVRLRTTFAATDSGGIAGSRLAVLDKYAHVLQEYNDSEIKALVDVAVANTSMAAPKVVPELLRGMGVDCTAEWITLGYPSYAQQKGCYYFEVNLMKECRSPQVGLLSTNFRKAPRMKGLQGGVGDDKDGWAADGQHAILWHGGARLPWNQSWPSENQSLSEDVVIGIAVDCNTQKIWFSSASGEWEETPCFKEDKVPKGASLYPAMSLQGRAAFNFGPDFKHKAPVVKGTVFKRWPDFPDGLCRVDTPIVGNSRNVRIYKEIQIHGELSLKRNVQRLVANKKHFELTKDTRSWAFKVDGVRGGRGDIQGSFHRTGARNGTPVYTTKSGACELHYDQDRKKWCISQVIRGKAPNGRPLCKFVVPHDSFYCNQEPDGCGKNQKAGDIMYGDAESDFDRCMECVAAEKEELEILAEAEPGEDLSTPPRLGWAEPREARGQVPVDVFKVALCAGGIASADVDRLADALVDTNAKGDKVVFRDGDGKSTTFEAEWEKQTSPPFGAEAAWALAVEEVKKRALAECGLSNATVIETEHPYPAINHTWTKTVAVDEDKQVDVYFSDDCRTYDSRTTLDIFGGGLSKALASVGARVNVKALTGIDQAHGTLVGKAAGGVWKVRVDSDEAEICGGFKTWMQEKPENYCATFAADEQQVATALYSGGVKVSSEIAGFTLDRSNPMTPFTVKGFVGKGPAQTAGAMVGWFLDVTALLREEAFVNLEGEGIGDPPSSLSQVAENLEEFERRLAAILESTDVTLTFMNGLEFHLLAQVCASYGKDQKVRSEINSFVEDGGVVKVGNILTNQVGFPAYKAGVRRNWQLNLMDTFEKDGNKDALGELTQEEVVKNPSTLLDLSNIDLIFEPFEVSREKYFSGYGRSTSMWKKLTVPSNAAEFVFASDGDKGTVTDNLRWGVLAVAIPGGSASEEDVEKFLSRWTEEGRRARGGRTKINVEPEDWDEDRLRALCARHGWEFEWMTEDGERRRRIEGRERARKVAEKSCAKAEKNTDAWWRLDSVAAALSSSFAMTRTPKEEAQLPKQEVSVKKIIANKSEPAKTEPSKPQK
eukprot:TRINITY_DN35264_c0_g1_i1.p1 TRINITY_DN35264_c0_g1~~TRINITY_DN35264_c0_g1_i1.p1  ORF type:complete len:1490 (+),score=346.70 TRINITY_DN35264_c0_g1_i1:27-4496(+)